MPILNLIEKEYVSVAFELAYFIIPDKGIALGIAEEAYCCLDTVLGKQERSRKLYKQPLGYPKWEERSRPLRTKIKLSNEQMLQWLIYYQADSWERATEYGGKLYPLTMEDLVVRYIKHLVRIITNKNSFYVTLGVTKMLYDYTTHEVRLMYDVLTASDSARMKDTAYLRKQKATLMEEIVKRFNGRVLEENLAHGEKRFEPQATTERLIYLVNECLRRFTPWKTICVIQEGFDPTAVPGFYASDTGFADEDRVEMNRIHAVLHPECFARLVDSLSQFIQRLPMESPDKNCRYDAPEKRLAVPQFNNINDGDPPEDRFTPPKLGAEDYDRLQQTREALRRRRKTIPRNQLRIYVDDVECAAFDPRRTPEIRFEIEPTASVLEVRSDDERGELRLATLIIRCDDISDGEVFTDWSVLEGGQKVTLQMRPIRNEMGDLEKATVAVSYAETNPVTAVLWYAQRVWFGFTEVSKDGVKDSQIIEPGISRLGKVGLVAAFILIVLALLWFSPHRAPVPPPIQVELPQTPEVEPPPSRLPPSPPPQQPDKQQPTRLIARAVWSQSPDAAREAIRLERVRGEDTKIAIPRRQTNLLIALPQADTESRMYTRYRITLLSAQQSLWQQILRAPRHPAISPTHILNLNLLQRRLKEDSLIIRFDGEIQNQWQAISQLTLQLVNQ